MKTNFKKLLSVVLVAMMIVTSFVVMPLAASAEVPATADKWDGTTLTKPEGDGTSKANAYKIKSAANWAWIVKNVGNADTTVYFELLADIDMAGNESLGAPSWTKMSVQFEGNNHTLYNFRRVANGNNGGFIDVVGARSSISNLHAVGFYVQSNNAGGLICLAEFGLQMTNCSIDATSYVEAKNAGSNVAGGLVASGEKNWDTNQPDAYYVFKDCVNNATVVNKCTTAVIGAAAGIMACTQQNNKTGSPNVAGVKMINCVNNGPITSGNTAAGILGMYMRMPVVEIVNCVNNGAILSQAQVQASGWDYCAAAGILGRDRDTCPGAKVTLKNCANTASVTMEAPALATRHNYTSAMIGHLQYVTDVTIENCANGGKITSAGMWVSVTLAGTIYNTMQKTLTIKDFANKGAMVATNASSAGTAWAYLHFGGKVTVDGYYDRGAHTVQYAESATEKHAPLFGWSTNPELLKYFTNCYAVKLDAAKNPNYELDRNHKDDGSNKADILTATETVKAANTTYAITYNPDAFKLMKNCDAVDSQNTWINLCNADGSAFVKQSTITMETDRIFANILYTDLDDAWDGTAVVPPTGSGTEADPFVISHGANIAYLARHASVFTGTVYMELANDIDMNGKAFPILKFKAPVNFDGKDFAIKNMTIGSAGSGVTSAGMFEALEHGSTIKNLHFVNANVYGAFNAGIVASSAEAALTVENVTTDEDSFVKLLSGNHAGGIIGRIYEPNATGKITFTKCVNRADVTSPNTAGGILGNNNGTPVDFEFSYCANYGDMTGSINPAGIWSQNERGNKVTEFIVSNCYNFGKITATASNYNWPGGILGCIRAYNSGATLSTLTVTNCYDFGARATKLSGTFSAIAGNADGSQLAKYATDCYGANPEGTAAPYATPFGYNAQNNHVDANSNGVVESLDAEITLKSGVKSTIRTEIEKINMVLGIHGENHVYSGECDAYCNACEAKRVITVQHTYDDGCDEECNECGYVRASAHFFDDGCDTECNECGDKREAQHTYDNACDTKCNVCQAERTITHTYSNDCDATCDVCGAERTPAAHKYTNDCDANCDVCGAARMPAAHVYTNDCDDKCNVCEAERTPFAHVYDNACDAKCNVCEAERDPADHAYTDACDATCNECGAERTPAAHAYDNDDDTTCNVCGDFRMVKVTVPEFVEITMPADEVVVEAGCSESVTAMYVVIALTAMIALAFVAKKKED